MLVLAAPPPALVERVRAEPVLAGLLVAGTVLAFALRFWGLTAVGLDSREASAAGEAASLVGLSAFTDLFPSARGDGQFFDLVLGAALGLFGATDLTARVVVAVLGVLTVGATYLAARNLYGTREAVVASLLLGFMPYHLLVSRLVSSDVLAGLLLTLALATTAYFARTERAQWIPVAAALLGLAVATEVSVVVFVAPFFLVVAHARWKSVGRRTLVLSAMTFCLVALAQPLSYLFNGQGAVWGGAIASELIAGQGTWYVYFVEVVPALGASVLVGLLAAAVLARRQVSWSEALLGAWIVVPFVLLLIWPERAFARLAGIAPPLAILAARPLADLSTVLGRPLRQSSQLAAIAVACGVLAGSSVLALGIVPAVAGSGQLPGLIGARDSALWVDEHVPRGATLLTTDTSFAEVLEFYGRRQSLGLVGDPDAAFVPGRTPVANPDLLIRHSAIQYIVWEAYSAGSQPEASDRLLAYAERYNGREIYRFEGERDSDGVRSTFPITIVFEVRP